MRTFGPKVFILHSQFHCIQFYVIYTIARHLLTWLLFESINSTLFYIPSECFGLQCYVKWTLADHSLNQLIV